MVTLQERFTAPVQNRNSLLAGFFSLESQVLFNLHPCLLPLASCLLHPRIMPYLRGLTVHIIDSEGNDLQEWGTQNLHRQQRISTYIQSTTGLSFQVSVQPRIPFIDRGHPLSDPESGSRGHQATRKVGRNAGKPLSSPIRTPNIQTPNPPYSFLASLYLDGRRTPERRVVVYLDPDNEDFTGPDGKVLFKHRWVQTSDDTMTEHAWIFKEVYFSPMKIERIIAKCCIESHRISI